MFCCIVLLSDDDWLGKSYDVARLSQNALVKPLYTSWTRASIMIVFSLYLSECTSQYTAKIIKTMSPSAVEVAAEAGPASGPDVALKPETSSHPPAQRTQPDHEEYQYIDLIRQIIDTGEHRPDR